MDFRRRDLGEADRYFPDVGKREMDFFTALFDSLRARGVATYITKDLPRLIGPAGALPFGEVSPLTDVLIHVRTEEQGGRRLRFVGVLKSRTRAHEETFRELRIRPHGITIAAAGEGPTTRSPRSPTADARQAQ